LITVGCLACVVSKETDLFQSSGDDLLETGHVNNGDLVLVLELDHVGDLDAKVVNDRGQMGWIYASKLDVVAVAPTYR